MKNKKSRSTARVNTVHLDPLASSSDSNAAINDVQRVVLNALAEHLTSIQDSIDALGERVDKLESGRRDAEAATAVEGVESVDLNALDAEAFEEGEPTWLTDRLLKERGSWDPHGAVAFGGVARQLGGVEEGEAKQWTCMNSEILKRDWEECVERLAAIAHPARVKILQRLLFSPASVQELVEENLVTRGPAYHHLKLLVRAGWVQRHNDGNYRIRATRAIALLSIMAAAGPLA